MKYQNTCLFLSVILIITSMILITTACKKEDIPSLSTLELTEITDSSAVCGGEITDNGGAEITARGVVYSTSTNPKISDCLGKTSDGTGKGFFTSNITGLSSDTDYYIRAYASNDAGTGYGNEHSFTTSESPFVCGETVTDVDDNVYQTVSIGDQCWMVENLRVAHYRDGSEIMYAPGSDNWLNNTDGAYCIYPHYAVDGINSHEEMLNDYGALYNWYAINNEKGLCPEGWQVPTDEDWQELEMFLGLGASEATEWGERGSDEGGKLKSARTHPLEHPRWDTINAGATDEYGFKALPSGIYGYYNSPNEDDRTFILVGEMVFFWTSTDTIINNQEYAIYRSIDHEEKTINRSAKAWSLGYSIRCLKK